jgi:hypothetical protein
MALMAMHDRRQVDWASVYFKFTIFRILLSVADRVLTFIVVTPLAIGILCSILWFPDYTDWVIIGYFGIFIAVFLLCIFWLIGLGIYRIFVPKRRKTVADWVPPNALPNPPGPWFSPSGELLWCKTDGGWMRVNPEPTNR